MRVAIDLSVLSLQKNGGISTYSKKLVEYLLKNNIAVNAIISDASHESMFSYNENLSFFHERFFGKLHQFKKINVPLGTDFLISPYYRIPSCNKVKYISVVHDFTVEKLRTSNWVLHKQIKNRSFRRADKIITISDATKKDLLTFFPYCSKKKIQTIYHGVDGTQYFPDLSRIELQENVNSYFVFLGSRARYKRFDLAIETALASPDVLLVIVGNELTQKESSFLDRTLPNRYLILSELSDPGLRRVLSNAICLIYPSDSEGFGMPILEAFSCGCPVIISNDPAMNEIGKPVAFSA